MFLTKNSLDFVQYSIGFLIGSDKRKINENSIKLTDGKKVKWLTVKTFFNDNCLIKYITKVCIMGSGNTLSFMFQNIHDKCNKKHKWVSVKSKAMALWHFKVDQVPNIYATCD